MTIDEEILNILEKEGRTTPSQIAKEMDKPISQIWQRLEILRLRKKITRVHRGLYEINEIDPPYPDCGGTCRD